MKTLQVLLLGLGTTTFAVLTVFSNTLLTTSPAVAEEHCNDTECVGYSYNPADFWVTVASDNGIDGRLLPETNPRSKSGDILPNGMRVHCIGWVYGEKVKALGLDTDDARWYLVEVPGIPDDLSHGHLGNTRYIPAAWVFGDAPDSTPLP
jgi:hypothetical protein